MCGTVVPGSGIGSPGILPCIQPGYPAVHTARYTCRIAQVPYTCRIAQVPYTCCMSDTAGDVPHVRYSR